MAAVDTMTPAGMTSTQTFVYPWRRLVSSMTIGGPVSYLYYLRGWDTGSGGRFVYWGPYSTPDANLTPTSDQTTPNYTGTLQNPHVWLRR